MKLDGMNQRTSVFVVMWFEREVEMKRRARGRLRDFSNLKLSKKVRPRSTRRG